VVGLVLILALGAPALVAQGSRERFDHDAHRKLFPTCLSCHPGAAQAGRSFWPAPVSCNSCHDGTIEKTVRWQPPPRRPTLLRFTHAAHTQAVLTKHPADTALACVACHAAEGAPWMRVSRGEVSRCLTCHKVTSTHFSAPDSACATCHRSLPEAPELSRERIAAFPAPLGHKDRDFAAGGHGKQAQPLRSAAHSGGVAASCATCHARDFCTQCHVNAPETPVIQALASDPRSLAIKATMKTPASHEVDRFQGRHGQQSRSAKATCANCHTQESCVACHRSNPSSVARLPHASPDRAVGAIMKRRKPETHGARFTERHGPLASASPNSCAGCHSRSECLDCHRPTADGANGYHQAGFLARHPSAAYNRQSDCSECHNTGTFCMTCHAQSGLSSTEGLLEGRYHDTKEAFLLSHGAAARRALESCVTCHTERDCLACHSSQTGRFDPHGPNFDADRLRRKNPETCSACHGRSIPRSP
jgi:hypothetical protein